MGQRRWMEIFQGDEGSPVVPWGSSRPAGALLRGEARSLWIMASKWACTPHGQLGRCPWGLLHRLPTRLWPNDSDA